MPIRFRINQAFENKHESPGRALILVKFVCAVEQARWRESKCRLGVVAGIEVAHIGRDDITPWSLGRNFSIVQNCFRTVSTSALGKGAIL
jgi:hypothetical protein